MTLKYFRFKGLLLKERWLHPAYVGIDSRGIIHYLSDVIPQEAIAFETVEGFTLPGFQNAHSHAFQYAMAGLAERHDAGTRDDFWTWREAMYQCALSVDPDQAEAIAAMLYTEMLRCGYTHVAEFHYLHHDKHGKHYHNLAEMGERMLAAAHTAGIKITLIPVFYQQGGFGKEPEPRQRRFISKTIDEYLHLVDDTAHAVSRHPFARLGFSVHSLRAVKAEDILKTVEQGPAQIPFHIHIAEQKKEVDDCLAQWNERPAAWLLKNLPVDERFHLIHATHLNDDELNGVLTSSANIVLCPSTEGNLGDGFFRMKDYVHGGGKWCIGTDSHIGLDPLEEFRMIDYRQRLLTHQRNTLDGNGADYLIQAEIENGRKAMGYTEENYFAIGQSLDAVVYDATMPLLSTTSFKNLLSTIVYAAGAATPYGTLVDGKWIIKGQHAHMPDIRKKFSAAIHTLNNR